MPKHPGKKKDRKPVAAKGKRKGNKGKTFLEKVRNRRKELESGDARGGKRSPKSKKK